MISYHTSEKSTAQGRLRMFSYVELAKTVLFHSIKRCISCGIGAVKCNSSPVTGWVNHSSYECSAGRAMRVLSSVP